MGEAQVVARKVVPAATVSAALERMRRASDAGRVAAWICENTDGESRDWDLCPKLIVHALESGATHEQAAEIVGCPYYPAEKVGNVKLTRAAGLQSLLRHTEGRAAFDALRSAAPTATYRPVVDASAVARFRHHRSRVARPLVDRIRGGKDVE